MYLSLLYVYTNELLIRDLVQTKFICLFKEKGSNRPNPMKSTDFDCNEVLRPLNFY